MRVIWWGKAISPFSSLDQDCFTALCEQRQNSQYKCLRPILRGKEWFWRTCEHCTCNYHENVNPKGQESKILRQADGEKFIYFIIFDLLFKLSWLECPFFSSVLIATGHSTFPKWQRVPAGKTVLRTRVQKHCHCHCQCSQKPARRVT